MKCVIMQPTYLPWSGYFNLIAQADVFVFFDDVQFEKGSWQSRNRILVNGQAHFITVPTVRESLSQHINTIQTDTKQKWRLKHTKLLQATYGKHPYGQAVLEITNTILDESFALLAELNINLIAAISEKLNLRPRFVRSSELNITGQRSERLLKFCQHFGCAEYISPVGSAEYLAQDGVFENAPVKLTFQQYTPGVYEQKGADDFISHLSIVDVAANIGWDNAAEYVRSGQVPATTEGMK